MTLLARGSWPCSVRVVAVTGVATVQATAAWCNWSATGWTRRGEDVGKKAQPQCLIDKHPQIRMIIRCVYRISTAYRSRIE